MLRSIRWGILGTGDIARQMAQDLRHVPDAVLHAVASRDEARAAAFGERHGIPVRCGSYEALLEDGDIDVVYIATPHTRHCEDALASLRAGKAVLCEKPLAMNRAEVLAMQGAARENKCFLMEAMWTAFFPAMRAVRQLIEEGAIGRPLQVHADFSYKSSAAPESRIFNPALGGGALLDIGIYTVAFADLVFKTLPTQIETSWTRGAMGTDTSSVSVLEYPGDRRAVLSSSLAWDAPQEGLIVGEDGYIRIPHRFSQPDGFSLHRNDEVITRTYPRTGYGYHLEAREVVRCVQAGERESAVASWAASLRVIEILDRIRNAWGLEYEADRN